MIRNIGLRTRFISAEIIKSEHIKNQDSENQSNELLNFGINRKIKFLFPF